MLAAEKTWSPKVSPSEEDCAEFEMLQHATEALLLELADSKTAIDERTISRLEKLAHRGAQLAFGRNCLGYASLQMTNLISWCDHLDSENWKKRFIEALGSSPLNSPFA